MDLPNEGQLIPLSGAAYTRVLFNLLLNARDAMPEGALQLSIDSGWHPDQYFIATAVLRVSDTGTGIHWASNYIFDPFYTTKGDQGTGLGLSAVQISSIGVAVAYCAIPTPYRAPLLSFISTHRAAHPPKCWLGSQSQWNTDSIDSPSRWI